MNKANTKIIVGLVIGFIFMIASYVIGVVLTISYICCFESNVYLGLLFIGPFLAMVGGWTGFLAGLYVQYFRHFRASWHQSTSFKFAIICIVIFSLIWLASIVAIITGNI